MSVIFLINCKKTTKSCKNTILIKQYTFTPLFFIVDATAAINNCFFSNF